MLWLKNSCMLLCCGEQEDERGVIWWYLGESQCQHYEWMSQHVVYKSLHCFTSDTLTTVGALCLIFLWNHIVTNNSQCIETLLCRGSITKWTMWEHDIVIHLIAWLEIFRRNSAFHISQFYNFTCLTCYGTCHTINLVQFYSIQLSIVH